MKKYTTEPAWRSVRGVGRPPDHPYSHDSDLQLHIELDLAKEVSRIEELQPGPSDVLPVAVPKCQRCGLSADRDWPNRWWCHYCWEEVKSPLQPNAMIPKSYSTATTLLPALSDPHGTETCYKCAVSFRPRLDNTGFTCPSCGETHRPPPAPRASPTNGF